MKKAMIFMCSLFSVTAAIAIDTRPFKKDDPAYTPNMARLEEKFQRAVAAQKNHEQNVKKAEQKLLKETSEGRFYKSIKKTWIFCGRNKGYDDSVCSGIYHLQEPALKQLKELSQYQEEYLPVLIEKDHNDLTTHILERARGFAAHQAHRYGSQKQAMLAGVDSYTNYNTSESTTNLRFSQDVSELMEQARKEVREFIEKEID